MKAIFLTGVPYMGVGCLAMKHVPWSACQSSVTSPWLCCDPEKGGWKTYPFFDIGILS